MSAVPFESETPLPATTGRGRLLDPWVLFTLAAAGGVALPVLVVASFVFVPSGDVWDHLASTVLPHYVQNSLLLMVGVGAGTLVVGVGTAWLVTLCRFPGRRVFEWALLLPLAVPAYVIAYSYTSLLDYAGPVQSLLRDAFGWTRQDYWFPQLRSIEGAIAMMTLVLYPYVYLLSRAAFLEQSACVLEVSRTLGCSPWRAFARVALPLARPAVAAGVALALMEALNDFGAVQHFGVDTFTTGIYRTWLGMGQPAAAAQLAAILMLFIAGVFLLERWSRGRRGFAHSTTRYRPLPRFHLRGLRAGLAIAACALPVLLGFFVPALNLGYGMTITADEWVDERFLGYALNSFTLAAIAAVLAVTVAVLMAYALRLRRTAASLVAVRVASMGYAIPGSVIAVGVMLPLAWIDNTVDGWMRSSFGISTGLIFSGTIYAVISAYLVRFLALSFNTVEASLTKVTASMDYAARSLGHGPAATLRRVHMPIIRGSLLTAGLVVFVDVMKELPATLVLRPFNFDTLATRTYELASDELLHEASSSALAIVAVGIVPVILLSRVIARSRPGHAEV
ncbi:MAG: iron ABC transporter permease [Alphaproteobacteria bacterium]|nr:MAG: iron ABC transporter permease [Alphaproteobacteria bacterium]